MKICARDHGRIAYNGSECPACQLVELVSDLQSQVDALNIELYDREIINPNRKGESL